MTNDICLVGLGYLGKIHLKLLSENPNWNLIGIYDIDKKLTQELAAKYQVKAFSDFDEALQNCSVVDIVTPSNSHYELAERSIRAGKHVFIEKPVTSTLEEARQLKELIHEAGICFQVGHVERFNPAFIAALPYTGNPRFIEIHRLAQYNVRGTDVSVVLDLMMHDLDLVLNLVKSNVRRISATGARFVSQSADIANVRIEFDNGCVANITTNRLAFKNVRKFRVFTESNLVSINLLDKVTEVIKIKDASPNSGNMVIDAGKNLPKKEIIFEHPVIQPANAINEELNAFFHCINSSRKSVVGIEDSIRVMELAFEIEEKTGI
jgi:predicted dehydrogenase